jgi:hypothetical protein
MHSEIWMFHIKLDSLNLKAFFQIYEDCYARCTVVHFVNIVHEIN